MKIKQIINKYTLAGALGIATIATSCHNERRHKKNTDWLDASDTETVFTPELTASDSAKYYALQSEHKNLLHTKDSVHNAFTTPKPGAMYSSSDSANIFDKKLRILFENAAERVHTLDSSMASDMKAKYYNTDSTGTILYLGEGSYHALSDAYDPEHVKAEYPSEDILKITRPLAKQIQELQTQFANPLKKQDEWNEAYDKLNLITMQLRKEIYSLDSLLTSRKQSVR